MTRALLLLALCLPLCAQSPAPASAKKHVLLWRVSLAVMAMASAADAGTSWHEYELNPLIAQGARHQFNGRGIVIKIADVLTLIQMERKSMHTPAERKVYIAINFAGAAMYGVTAWHNTTVGAVGVLPPAPVLSILGKPVRR